MTTKLRGVAVTASNLRSGDKKFAPDLSNDGKTKTYWAMADGVTSGYLFYRFSRPTRLNTLVLQEYIALGQRVKRFRIETETSPGVFEPVATSDSLTTIGYKRIIRFAPVETKSLRVTFEEARGPVCIAEIAAYLTPEVLEAPKIRRDESDKVHITSVTPDVLIEYAIEELRPSTPRAGSAIRVPSPSAMTTLRSAPASPRRPIRTALRRPSASASQPHRSRRLHWAPMTARRCSTATATRRSRSKLGRLHSSCSSRTHVPSRSSSTRPLSSVMPRGHVRSYSIYVDGQKVASGNFDNIQNNPIPQEVLLPAGTSGSRIRFVA